MKAILFHKTTPRPGETGGKGHTAAHVATFDDWRGPWTEGLSIRIDGKWWVIVRLAFISDGTAYVLVMDASGRFGSEEWIGMFNLDLKDLA